MKKQLLSLLLLFGAMASAVNAQAQRSTPDAAVAESMLVGQALEEIDLSLSAYFQLIDEEDLLLFVTAVSHAARGRLLLEQYLGEDIDNFSLAVDEDDGFRYSLILIANHAKKFTGEEAREMWRRDHAFDNFENAKMELATWDVMVQGLKKQLAGAK